MKSIFTLTLLLFILIPAFAWDNGNGTETAPYLISSPRDLVELSSSLLSHEGEHFKMTNDINMSGITDFRAIGTAGEAFKGHFNGDNYKISNLIVTIGGFENDYIGLFGKSENSELENIHIAGISYFEGKNYIAAIAGFINNGVIRGCSSSATIIGNQEYSNHIAGIAGHAFSSLITQCNNTGQIIANGLNTTYIGGITGDLSNNGNISDCYNLGIVGGAGYVGGICGSVSSDGSEVANCYNKGIITSTNEYVGGIAGSVSTGLLTTGKIQACYNTGEISGRNYVGGISGYAAIIVHSCNIAPVHSSGNYSGGIAGAGAVYNSYNKGNVSGNTAVGGVVGNLNYVDNCFNTGEISGNSRVGGIAGEITGTTDNMIYNSYNTGNVSISNSETSVGAIAGYLNSGGFINTNEIKNSYWNSDIYSGRGVGNRENPTGTSGSFQYFAKTGTEMRNNFHTILSNGGNAWSPDSESTNNGYPVLTGDVHSINPGENIIHTISIYTEGNGTVSGEEETRTAEGSALLYFITAGEGWIIDKFIVNGTEMGSPDIINIENISEDIVMNVIFRQFTTDVPSLNTENINYRLMPEGLYIENAKDRYLNIYDISGKLIFNSKIVDRFVIVNISFLKEGLYIVNLFNPETNYTFRIIK